MNREKHVNDALAVLTRELRARVINVSKSGCLIESHQRLAVGTIGSLRLRIGGHEYLDVVEVMRCQPIQGSSVYHVGVRFLTSTSRDERSLRDAVPLYEQSWLECRLQPV